VSDDKKVWHKFYLKYGKAMVAWSGVESELVTLFSLLTKIKWDMAVGIFYAPSGFKGRTAIFRAALKTCAINEPIRSLTDALLGKAEQYSDWRNKLAHDYPALHGAAASKHIRLITGKGQFQSDATKKIHVEAGITTEEIEDIGVQFQSLQKIICDFWGSLTVDRIPSPHIFQQRLAELPKLPRPKAQTPPNVKPGRRRKPSLA